MRSRYDVGETWKLRKHLQDRYILEDKDDANYYNLTQKLWPSRHSAIDLKKQKPNWQNVT